jgi:hypothetical protein
MAKQIASFQTEQYAVARGNDLVFVFPDVESAQQQVETITAMMQQCGLDADVYLASVTVTTSYGKPKAYTLPDSATTTEDAQGDDDAQGDEDQGGDDQGDQGTAAPGDGDDQGSTPPATTPTKPKSGDEQ